MSSLENLYTMEVAVLSAAGHIISQLTQPASILTWRKIDKSLVMELDFECQEIILNALGDKYMAVCEEDLQSHALLNNHSDIWLIDPVDGTSTCAKFSKELDSKVLGTEIGFGPLVGWLSSGKIEACCFFHIPRRTLFSALRGSGAWQIRVDAQDMTRVNLPVLTDRTKLLNNNSANLQQSSAIYYKGKRGELELVKELTKRGGIKHTAHYGGFANDCARLALGLEQIQIQFSVKPWDLCAVLLEVESGLKVMVDPISTRTPFWNWEIKDNNPVLAYSPQLEEDIMEILDTVTSGKQ